MKIILCHSRKQGLTRLELIVTISILATFAVTIFSTGQTSKDRALRIQCMNNLKQTGLAFEVWADAHRGKYPMEISKVNGVTMDFVIATNLFRQYQIISNELSTPHVLVCPADKAQISATSFQFFSNSNISYFQGLDFARSDTPSIWCSNSNIWFGDRNITNQMPVKNGILELTSKRSGDWTDEIHRNAGNVVLADGSVRQLNNTGLHDAVATTSVATNHLLMPVLAP